MLNTEGKPSREFSKIMGPEFIIKKVTYDLSGTCGDVTDLLPPSSEGDDVVTTPAPPPTPVITINAVLGEKLILPLPEVGPQQKIQNNYLFNCLIMTNFFPL